jgi:predicted ATPase
VCWQLGEFVRAQELSNEAIAWAIETGHAATIANTWSFKAGFEMTRGDAEAALHAALALADPSQRHKLSQYEAVVGVYSGWARARLGAHETGIAELRQALTALIGQGNKLHIPHYQGRLAEIEAAMGNAEAALLRIDQALALANETGQHQCLALLHRIRGEILLTLGRSNTKSAEESFLAAIGIARQQEVRTDQLLAALALANLYRATRRNADARAVLVPALEGFTPTLELPQIEEAQSLLARLAEGDEVKSSAAARERRLKLQTDYGLAVAWSKGFAAEETKAAFARAEELSTGTGNLDQRFTSLYGQWITSLVRGELGTARDVAETFRYEAESAARMPETVAALRYLGLTCLCQGHFVEARTHLEEVLRIHDPGRDREANFRFGTDSLASATIYLAQAYWQLGDFRQARELSDEAIARAVESAHDASLAHTWSVKAVFEMSRGDAQATSRAAQAVIELSQRLRLPNYLAQGRIFSGWALTQLGAGEAAIDELRQALTEYIGLGNKLRIPFLQGKLAEVEARAENAETALVRIDEALALANETGQHQDSAILQCIRGEILLKLDPAKSKPAKESFLSAIAIAQQQGARTDRLHAALALAKLYQESGRPGDARVVLTPALERFTPTPELPEIGKARALLEGLSSEATRR